MKKFLFLIACILTYIQSIASDFNAVCPSGQTLYYNIISADDHTVSVTYPGTNNYWTGYTQPEGNVIIPASVNHGGQTYTVTKLGDYAFYECNSLTGITIPNTITHIGTMACSVCGLTSVTIPNSVNHIEGYAFYGNPCTTITIANQNAMIDGCVFHYTTWYNNQNDGLIYIGSILYEYKGTVPANTTLSISPATTSIAGKALYGQSGITAINLPNTLKAIGDQAFYGCGGITTITIPSSVEHMANKAFENCGGLTTVNYNAINCSIYQPISNVPFYYFNSGFFIGCDNLLTLNIGNGVTHIPPYAFCGLSQLNGSLSLPSSLTTIGNHAFYGCSGLTSIALPNALTLLDSYAFSDCSSLTSITFPQNLDSIGIGICYNCTSLQTINYNAINCQHSYNGYSFYNCNNITTINFGSTVQSIPPYLCLGLSSITEPLTLPNSLTTISDHAFFGCSGITGSLLIPNSVSTIGDNAFSGCSGFSSITIGTGLNSIGAQAFSGMNGLTTINFNAINCSQVSTNSWIFTGDLITTLNIGNNVQVIPDGLVYFCPNLTSVTFPPSLTRIGSNAFQSCGLSGTLTIPASVFSIGYGAFTNVTTLSEIVCPRTTPPLVESLYGYSYIFIGCWDTPLLVPCESISAYQSAPGWSYFTNISGIGGCNYTVTITVNDPTMGTVNGTGTYPQGSSITINAIPFSGYRFDHWSDGSTENPRTITVNGNISLTAYFALNPTAVEDNNLNEIQVYTQNGEIIIKGIDRQPLVILNIDGRTIATIDKPDCQTIIKVPSSGVYIVRIGTHLVKKIVVR